MNNDNWTDITAESKQTASIGTIAFKVRHSITGTEGIAYRVRQCGEDCLAMLGDESSSRQKQLTVTKLGALVAWKGSWAIIGRLDLRIATMPSNVGPPKI
jgi:hypothetical protein